MNILRTLLIFLISSTLILYIPNKVYAEQEKENTNDEMNIDECIEALDELDSMALIGNEGIFKDSDSILIKEILLFNKALSETLVKLNEMPDISNYELITSINLHDRKLTDITEDSEGNIYALFYVPGKAYKFNGKAILDFLYNNINKATGINISTE